MKKSLLVSLTFLLTAAIVYGHDYYPWSEGFYCRLMIDTLNCPDWTPNRIGREIYVEGTDSILNQEYLRIKQTDITSDGSEGHLFYLWVGEDSGWVVLAGCGNDSIVASAITYNPPQLFLPDSAPEGYSWEVVLGSELLLFSIESYTETVHVPLGDFDDCLMIRQVTVDTTTGDTIRISWIYFAPDTGHVLEAWVFPDSCREELVEVTSVEEDEVLQIPHPVNLQRNYPNPLRTTTTISYTLPTNTQVCLSIYDTAGRLISTLVEETQEAGYYSVPWNRTDMFDSRVPSGVYFYRIEAGDYTATKKMILLR